MSISSSPPPHAPYFPVKTKGIFSLCPEETSSYTGRENFLLLTNRERETEMLGRQGNGRRREKLDERGSENVREKKKTSFVIPDEGG